MVKYSWLLLTLFLLHLLLEAVRKISRLVRPLLWPETALNLQKSGLLRLLFGVVSSLLHPLLSFSSRNDGTNRILKKSIPHIKKKIKNHSSYQLWGMQSTGKERSCSTVKLTSFCIQHILSISSHLCISGSKSPYLPGKEGQTHALSNKFRVNQKASNQVKNATKSCKITPRWSFHFIWKQALQACFWSIVKSCWTSTPETMC